MTNMSYCRFRNTSEDVEDCLENLQMASNAKEIRDRARLIYICRQLVADADRMGIESEPAEE